MKRVLITGHEGFIGKRLYERLSSSNLFSIKGLNEDYLNSYNWINELKKILNNFRPDVIFHVGACSNTLETDSNYMMVRNYESTKVIAEWAGINNIPLIYSSSAAIYGTNMEYPSNLYGWSKYVAEDIVTISGGISLRYFNVYGPGEENKGIMASVAYQMFIKNKNKEEVKLFPGKPSRDFIYVDDVVDANIFAYINYNNLEKEYYDVGSGQSRTFEDVLEIMNIPYSYHNENDIPIGYQFNTKSNSKLWMLGWAPNFTIDNGLINYKKYLENENII